MDLSSWPSPLVDFNVYKSETVRQYAPPGIMQLGSTCHYLWSFLAKIMNRMNQTFKSKKFLNPRIWEIDEQSKWYHRKQPSRSRMYKIPKTVPRNELICSTIEWHEKRRALLPDFKKRLEAHQLNSICGHYLDPDWTKCKKTFWRLGKMWTCTEY